MTPDTYHKRPNWFQWLQHVVGYRHRPDWQFHREVASANLFYCQACNGSVNVKFSGEGGW